MLYPLYRGLTGLGEPLILRHLRRRLAQGREDPARFPERLGAPGRPRPPGRLLWVHAASLGEAVSVLPLLGRLRAERPRAGLLVTTGTVSSARFLADRLPAGAIHQYVPADRPEGVRRFLDHWAPDLALWVEAELWPNLVTATQARGVPMVLVNGRMSERSWRRWRRARPLARRLLAGFRLALAQSEADARRLADLGAAPVRCRGNLKYAAPPLPVDPAELARLRAALAGRPVWLAASTHDPEEALVGRVHAELRARHPGLLTILAPRHPERGDAVVAALAGMGLTTARRSQGALPGPAADVYLADTLGELGLFCRLADLVFVGGSLMPKGGHNPLEPARLRRPVLYGPAMSNFAEIAAELERAGGAVRVADAADLARMADRLLRDPEARERIALAGERLAAARAGVLDAVLGELEPFLAALDREEGAVARA